MNNLTNKLINSLKLPKIISWRNHQKQQTKIKQLHNLAQIGKLSAGIFHDLVNPLTAIALNLEQAKKENGQKINCAYQCLNQALIAAHHMEQLLLTTKQQVDQSGLIINFNLQEKIKEIINMLNYKAKLAQINLQVKVPDNIIIRGPVAKLGRVLINLINNALEAYIDSQSLEKVVKITAQVNQQTITIQIIDQAGNLSPKIKNQIFKAFFSTKNHDQIGSGLGLYISREIIIQDFAGNIKLIEHPTLTIFQIVIPNSNLV